MKTTDDQIQRLKEQAGRLKDKFKASGEALGHSQALELIAQYYGYKDWNTLSAAVRSQTLPLIKGDRVSGQYLSHPFTATVVEVRAERVGWYWLRLQLDEAIDVVESRHFSSWRSQLRATVNREGVTDAKTSNGVPHLQLDLPD